MAATHARSRERTAHPAKKPVAAIVALLCDLAAWLGYPFFWDEDGYVAIGALMVSVFLAACGALVALLGLLVSSVRSRHNRPSPRPDLALTALTVSVFSIPIFIATFDWIVNTWD